MFHGKFTFRVPEGQCFMGSSHPNTFELMFHWEFISRVPGSQCFMMSSHTGYLRVNVSWGVDILRVNVYSNNK